MCYASYVTDLNQGNIIAYPTESTWGLGVDACNPTSVKKLQQLKNRSTHQSFIVLIPNIHLVKDWIDWQTCPHNIDPNSQWPGPITKVFPVTPHCPEWLQFKGTIALRISAHPVTQALCQAFGRPLISTSANRSGEAPLTSPEEISDCFPNDIASIVPGQPGGSPPTRIVCLLTNQILREST